MAGSLTIRRARLVLPDRTVTGDLVVEDGVIAEIAPSIQRTVGEEIDAAGLHLLPGAVDTHVCFRDPGKTYKEDLASGSRAAAAGGVTSVLDMPDNDPPTDTTTALHRKLERAADKSVVHYGSFLQATPDNLDQLGAERACGIVCSSGDASFLARVLEATDKLVAVHGEHDERQRERGMLYENSSDPSDHSKLHDVEMALLAARRVVALQHKFGGRVHLLGLSTADELFELEGSPVTATVRTPHLFLDDTAYATLGARAQCDPPLRTARHREALWKALHADQLRCISSGHEPHTLEEKARGYPNTPSGMPGVEWTLPLLLDQVAAGRITLQQVASWLAEGPARCFGIVGKGRIEVGWDGDLVLVDLERERTVEDGAVRTRCGWSPWAGRTLRGWPVLTVVLGQPVYRDDQIVDGVAGQELAFAAH